MSNGTAKSFDFREPSRLADEVETILSAWQTAFCTSAQTRWNRHTAAPIEFKTRPITTARISELREQLPSTAINQRILVLPDREPMLLVVPRPLALGVVSLMFGTDAPETIEDRCLTDVENSLVDLAFSELEASLNLSQPCSEPVACHLDGPQQMTDIKRLFNEDQVAVATVEISGPFGSFPCHWVLSQAAVFRFVSYFSAENEPKQAPPDVKDILRRINIQLVVRLGNAKLHFSELTRLRVGDVVMLDQRVGDPLDAYVQDSLKFRGWPGRCGSRQAIQITSVVQE